MIGTATEQLTTTEGAVLALLAIEGERSPYELHRLVASAIAHVWSPARSGLFATLPRLERDGLASSRRDGRRQLYRITRGGRAALAEWLETVEPGARETFFLKLFVGGLTSHEVLLDHLAQFRDDVQERLDTLHEIDRTNTSLGHDRYHRYLLELGLDRAQQELAWAARVERSLRRTR